MWHQKYSLPCTKVLNFVACIVISRIIGNGAVERYWVDVKTIKSDKISAISSDISEKKSIVYTSAYNEPARIEQYPSDKKINDHC